MHLVAALHKQNPEVAVNAFKDLIANGECKKKILCMFVDFYSDNFMQGQQNILLLNNFLRHTTSCMIIANKKNSIHIFQKEIFQMIAICCKSNITTKNDRIVEAFDISTIEALVENFGKKRHEEITFLIEEGKISKDLYKILNIFYYKVRYQQKEEVLGILGWILGLKTLNIAEINYEEVSCVKAAKNDIVWYLWKLALLLGKYRYSSSKIIQRFIESHLSLFTIFYQKQKRAKKLGILYHVYFVLSSKNIMKYITEEEIDIPLYHEEIESVQLEEDHAVEEKEIDMSYLNYYTTFNADLATQVEKEKLDLRKICHEKIHPVVT